MTAGDPQSVADGATLEGSQRVDRWVWAARFFRTRSAARTAVRTGKVAVNGARAKPARRVRVGDRVDLQSPAGRFVVDVEALNEQRRPAPQARTLYTETPESVEARRQEAEARRQRRAAVVFDDARPDRRERRAAIRFRRRGGLSE